MKIGGRSLRSTEHTKGIPEGCRTGSQHPKPRLRQIPFQGDTTDQVV